MKLLTKSDLARLQKQDPYHETGPGRELPATESMVITKFFTPDANWTWYAVSASQDPDTGNVQFFGLVDGNFKELGYFWLSELEKVRGPLGLQVERDMYWQPVPLSDLLDPQPCKHHRQSDNWCMNTAMAADCDRCQIKD